jgi:hypothetical protein
MFYFKTLRFYLQQDIDLSPSFAIFLSTRDPTVEFAPDICSRLKKLTFYFLRRRRNGEKQVRFCHRDVF